MATITRIRCDFCDGETAEAWYYPHPAFVFCYAGTLIDVKAGAAAACPQCAPLIEKRNLPALSRRCVRPGDGPVGIAIMAEFQRLLVPQLGGRRHVKLGDDEPKPERFFTDKCPRCGKVHNLDRTTAIDRAIKYTCECGLDTTIGAVCQ